MSNVIRVQALIQKIKELIIENSDFVKTEDVTKLMKRINNNEIDKFGNETEEEDK